VISNYYCLVAIIVFVVAVVVFVVAAATAVVFCYV
jgi:hypothetical protein